MGRALYEALFTELAARGMVVAVAGMTEPNEASAALHRALGFTEVGTFRGVGWKLGAWRDVTWFRRALAEARRTAPGLSPSGECAGRRRSSPDAGVCAMS